MMTVGLLLSKFRDEFVKITLDNGDVHQYSREVGENFDNIIPDEILSLQVFSFSATYETFIAIWV